MAPYSVLPSSGFAEAGLATGLCALMGGSDWRRTADGPGLVADDVAKARLEQQKARLEAALEERRKTLEQRRADACRRRAG
ncbi:hypothetical protein ACWKT5_01935 [Streptomyces avermitilis]